MASKRIFANISPEAHKILLRVAAKSHQRGSSRPPIGKVLTVMIEWFEDKDECAEIEETVRDGYARSIHIRKEKDRERKRKTL